MKHRIAQAYHFTISSIWVVYLNISFSGFHVDSVAKQNTSFGSRLDQMIVSDLWENHLVIIGNRKFDSIAAPGSHI